MGRPSIAVVIPLYNKAPHIVKTLESVLAQIEAPNEIIVVDDGSSDGSAEVVLPYVERYGVRLVRQENAGVSAARNRGILESRSEFVAFLDADDYWLQNHIHVTKELIVSFPGASVFSTAHLIERGGTRFRPRTSYNDGWQGVVDNFFDRYARCLCLINSTTACVRREALLAVGGFPVGVRRGEDIICWINLALKFRVAHAETVTAVYYQDAVNRTDRLREQEPPGSLRHIAYLLQTKNLPDDQRQGLSLLFDRIAFFTAAGMKASGDSVGLKSIRDLAVDIGHYRLASLITCLSFTPRQLLLLAKKFRHPRVGKE